DAAPPESLRWSLVPCRVEGKDAKGPGAWLVASEKAFQEGGEAQLVPDVATRQGVNCATPPALLDEGAFGFNKSGDLIRWSAAGSPVKPPEPVDGVLLVGGRQIEGSYVYDPHENLAIVTVHPKAGGAPVVVALSDIVVAESGGRTELRGEDPGAYGVWHDAS